MNFNENFVRREKAELLNLKLSNSARAKVLLKLELDTKDQVLPFLNSLRQTHSKMKNLQYEKFEVSKYLSSPLFSRNSRWLLLSLRTRTVCGIRSDFPGICIYW